MTSDAVRCIRMDLGDDVDNDDVDDEDDDRRALPGSSLERLLQGPSGRLPLGRSRAGPSNGHNVRGVCRRRVASFP